MTDSGLGFRWENQRGGKRGDQRDVEKREKGRTGSARRGSEGIRLVCGRQKGGPGSGCKPGAPHEP